MISRGIRAAVSSLALLAPPLAQAAGDDVTIDTGKLHGATVDGVTSFKGIPFAQPPLGNLRWKAPQPVAKWQGVKEATSYGSDCMQEPFPGDAAPLGVTPNEDCLYINVWVPAKSAGRAAK